jgi:glycosyltransferase involved in cell wall biosynthesis
MISVVVRTYQRLPRLQRALASAFGQTRPPDEVIVVDDGSSDGTLDWVRAQGRHWRGLRLLRDEANQGAAAAGNSGLRAAKGDLVAFLDSDDEWHPRFLEFSLAALEASPAAPFSLSAYEEVWEPHDLTRWTLVPPEDDLRPLLLLGDPVPSLSLALFRRPALGDGFDLRWRVAADRALVRRVAFAHKGVFARVPQMMAMRRLHDGNLSGDAGTLAAELRRATAEVLAGEADEGLRRLSAQAEAAVEETASTVPRQRRLFAAERPSVSVIMATHNRKTLLTEALASVDAQTVTPLEIIVCDDASSDGTQAFLESRRSDRFRVLRFEEQRGGAAAINAAIAEAKGEIVTVLDDDDTWAPDYLEAILPAHAFRPAPVFVFADAFVRYEHTGRLVPGRHGSVGFYGDLLEWMLLEPFPLTTTVFSARREDFLAVGGFDEANRRIYDVDLSLRMLARDEAQYRRPPAVVRRKVATHRIHRIGRNIEKNRGMILDGHRRRTEKFLSSPAGAPYRHRAADIERAYQAQIAQLYEQLG